MASIGHILIYHKKKDIENYILYNTSVDDILDKINKFGIDSITEIDKKILG